MLTYDGPIIDAHHHLWDMAMGRHPWLHDADQAIGALGDIGYMRRDYLPAELLADIGHEAVVASVAVEAVWDKSRPVTEEVDWLAALSRPTGIASRFVAAASLRDPAAAARLDALAQRPIVAGVRETVRWHPDPAKRWSEAGLMDDPAWRAGVALLARHDLLLELLMNPFQSDELARLAADMPGQVFVVNHCGSPVDRDAEGLARWRAGLAAIAGHHNTAIKLSNFAAYAEAHTADAYRRTIMTCIDAFGPSRVMFASDYPVARRSIGYRDSIAAVRTAIADLSAIEQRAVFHDTAARLYQIPPVSAASR